MPVLRSVDICQDSDLGYEQGRTRFVPGAGLAFDEAYRLAHLPLIAPDHAAVIARKDGEYYDRGRHPRTVSLVLPIADDTLRSSPDFLALEAELRQAPFAAKIAWQLLDRRRSVLHATICSRLAMNDSLLGGKPAPLLTPGQRTALGRIGPVAVELRGLFSGDRNVGRLYLRVYPERRGGDNLFHQVQRILGRGETDIYLVGMYNLLDPLDAREAAALDELIRRWWSHRLLRFETDLLWLLAARDDLVLEGVVEEVVSLSGAAA